jgi:hypothetical protein
MTDNNKLRVSELDFDQIKLNLKEYLRSQPEFSDYDFDGSGMSVLLDVLAYNTYYGSYYDNMVANESRLHSAILRESVVSKAKELGYVPTSRKAPVALLNVRAKPKDPTQTPWTTTPSIILPKGKSFGTILEGKNYDYVVLDDYVLGKDIATGHYINSTPIPVYEGKLKQASFIVDYADPHKKYVIPSAGVDKTTIRVYIRRSINEIEQIEWFPASTFQNPEGTNNSFWVWEVDGLKYEIEFGDGILGKKLKDGNLIVVEYLVTNGELTNGCRNFRMNSSIAGLTNVEVITVNKSFGGAEAESLESIKFNAPRAYSNQSRAVVEEDYEYLLYQEFPAAESLIVWGGEKNDPPQYGKVFVAIKPQSGGTLTEPEKDYVKSLIKKFNLITIAPEIVDPDYILLLLDVSVVFDRAKTVNTDNEIKILVTGTIDDFNENNIGKFGLNYRHSQLTSAINAADPSIVSNLIDVTLQKFYYPIQGVQTEYTLDFKDALLPETIIMTGFKVTEQNPLPNSTYKVVDDGLGKLKLVRMRPEKEDLVIGEVGYVDYSLGVVKIQNFLPTTIYEDETYRRAEFHTLTSVDINVNGYIQLQSDIPEENADLVVEINGQQMSEGVHYTVDDVNDRLVLLGLDDNPPVWQIGYEVRVDYYTTRKILRVNAVPVDEDVITSRNTIIEISKYDIAVTQGRG